MDKETIMITKLKNCKKREDLSKKILSKSMNAVLFQVLHYDKAGLL